MAPIDRSWSNATLQPNMYIEKFNISWLSLCITDVAASEKNTWQLRALRAAWFSLWSGIVSRADSEKLWKVAFEQDLSIGAIFRGKTY